MCMMSTHVCSSIRLQINKRCVALQSSRGYTAFVNKQNGPVPHLCGASLHNRASLEEETNLRTLLQFPIVKVPLSAKMQLKYGGYKTFDLSELCRGSVVTLACLTNLMRKGSPARVKELLNSAVLYPITYDYVLKGMSYSSNNRTAANERVVNETDVVQFEFGNFFNDLKIPFKHEDLHESWQHKYPWYTTVYFRITFKYVKNFEQKLGDQFSYEPKPGDSMDAKTLKHMQTKVMNMFDKDIRMYDVMFMRYYTNRSLETPITPWGIGLIKFSADKQRHSEDEIFV